MNLPSFRHAKAIATIGIGLIITAFAGELKPVDEKARAALKQEARERMAEDRDEYSRQQLGELEELYQVANKNWKTDRPKAKKAMEKLVKEYKKANRTGCAMLYLGQLSYGDERDDYLNQAIEDYSDCFYGNGVQVGGWARFLRMLDLKSDKKQKEAAELEKEIREDYGNSINHSGILLVDLLDKLAAEE